MNPTLKQDVEAKPKRQMAAWGAFALGLAILGLLAGFELLVPKRGSVSQPGSRPAVRPASRSLSRGHDLVRQRHYEEARLEFLRATQENPDDAVAWADLGAADAVLGRVQEARGVYERALGLEPDHWLAQYNLAVILARSGDHEGAVRHLRTALHLARTLPAKRQEMVADLRKDPSLRKLLGDPRISPLAGP